MNDLYRVGIYCRLSVDLHEVPPQTREVFHQNKIDNPVSGVLQHLQKTGWANIIQRYTEITELDESILFELVDRIEVGEPQRRGSIRIQDVKVRYRYVGVVDDFCARSVSYFCISV